MILLYIYIIIALLTGLAYSVYYWRYEYQAKYFERVTLKWYHILIFKVLLFIIMSVLAPLTAYELISKLQKKRGVSHES